MTTDRKIRAGRWTRFSVAVMTVAALSTIGLAIAMSSPGANLAARVDDHGASLEAISQRAEQLERFTRHVRKVNLTTVPADNLPFGGYIANLADVEPGAILSLDWDGGQKLEVFAARRMARSFGLVVDLTQQQVDLMLVTGHVVGVPDSDVVSFLVAVPSTTKVTEPTTGEDQSL